jgi:hypothetical protein
MKRFFTLATVVATTGLLLGAGFAGTAGASTGVAASRPQPGGTIIRAPGNGGIPTISYDWSGYAATSVKKFNYVSSQFVQPAVTCPGVANQWTSNWVGLDGFTTDTVEQDGTFGFCGGKGSTTPEYEAWYEMYPAFSANVFRVKPGDVIDESVRYFGGKFHLAIADVTSGRHFTFVQGCATCARASAEWIIERPALCNNTGTKCFLTALADFHSATMAKDEAELAGAKVRSINWFNNYPIYMVNPLKTGGFISLDTAGPVTDQSFTATWDRSGSTLPITLGTRR